MSGMPKTETVCYSVGGFSIEVPESHPLPKYQAQHRLYDRFIGTLGECLPDGALVIDVGANVGDSLAALCASGQKEIICIEGSSIFLGFLRKNARLVAAKGNKILCVHAIVGIPGNRATVVEAAGTGKAVPDGSGTPVRSLDEITESSLNGKGGPTLIKVDTDGADAQVLISGAATVHRHKPLIFWENEIASMEVLSSYVGLYRLLHSAEYDLFTIFDNFGNIICETHDPNTLVGFAHYLLSLHRRISVRTIYYVDVLASSRKFRDVHIQSVRAYRARFFGTV